MPLFHFHFIDGCDRQIDEIGLDLPDVETAYLQAVASARSMGTELMTDGVNPASCAFEIADAGGTVLFSVAFSELFQRNHVVRPEHDRVTKRLSSMLEDTHRRAVAAKGGVAISISRARTALAESRALLARLDSVMR